MHVKSIIAALGVAAAMAGTAAAAPNWINQVRQSTAGAFIVGNPQAKTKLVEYISYTCPHCAAFTTESHHTLAKDVANGSMSVEIRNAVRDRYDLTASVLARCGGADKFYGNHMALMANHDAWMDQIRSYEAGHDDDFSDVTKGMQSVAAGTGLNALMAKRGFSTAQINACLAGKDAQDKVLAMADEAWKTRKIPGTPTFLINGQQQQDVFDWASLKAKLPGASN